MRAEVQRQTKQAATARSETMSLRKQLDAALAEQRRLYEGLAAQRAESRRLQDCSEQELSRGKGIEQEVKRLTHELHDLRQHMGALIKQQQLESEEQLDDAKRREESLENARQQLHENIR